MPPVLTTAELQQAKIARVERNLVYAMHSGLALLLDAYISATPNGYGAVHICGSGWNAPLSPDARPLKESGHVPIEVPPLTQAGYTIFSINHRAAPRFRYPDPVLDCQRAVRWIRAHAAEYGIDPGRVGAIGGSSGGHLVGMLGVLDGQGDPESPSKIERQSARVQCVVSRAGVYQIIGINRPLALLGHNVPEEDDGSPEAKNAIAASPITYVSAKAPPMLLVHGTDDAVVPIEQSQVFAEALQVAGVPVQFIPVEGAGHGPGYPGADIDISEIQAAYVDWFDRHLQKI